AAVMDPDGQVGRAYHARTTPQMVVIDPAGKIVYAGAIDDKRSANVADVKTATNYVAQALTEARAGKPVSVASTQPYGCSVKYP
ncbi:MAG: thioredoxin family protein, partial [Betaproteobacteria bacterium]